MNATANFTSYNDKSSAKRGFGRKFKELADKVENYLEKNDDGKWGFYTDVNGDPITELEEMQASAAAFKPTAEQHAEVMAIVQKAHPEAFKELTQQGTIKPFFPSSPFGASNTPADAPAPKADAELEQALHQHHDDGSDVGAPAQDAFSAFAHAQLTSRPQPVVEPAKATSNNTRVERNREEANGVKRPSAGTLCAQVWDIATQLSNGDEKPRTKIATLSEVVKAAEAKGINKFTARTQYARWRVFHGITGRNV